MSVYNTAEAARHQRRADDLFNRTFLTGFIRRFIKGILRRDMDLVFLNDAKKRAQIVDRHQLATNAVAISKIKGTDGRLDRFDDAFYPKNRRGYDRWVSIAEAMLNNPTSLPPVQLVKIDDVYYVIDGHHRISVAKALRYDYIDADVTEWVLDRHIL